MNRDQANAVSLALIEREISHTIQVGVHPSMIPSPSYRIDVQVRGIEGSTLEYLTELDKHVRMRCGKDVKMHVSTFPNVGVYIA